MGRETLIAIDNQRRERLHAQIGALEAELAQRPDPNDREGREKWHRLANLVAKLRATLNQSSFRFD